MILLRLQAPVTFTARDLLLLHVAAMTRTHDLSKCTVYGQSNPLDFPNSKLTSCVAQSPIFIFNKKKAATQSVLLLLTS